MGFLVFAGSAFNFITNNFTTIAYAVIFVVIAIVLWQGYGIVRENAQDQILIQQYKSNEKVYQQTIADKNKQIQMQQDLVTLSNQIVLDRDNTIKTITDEYNDVVNSSLGKDLSSPAADALKELIRKLQSLENSAPSPKPTR